ncbi:hypothetical protein FOZ62_018431, partial [Perkinsus olseni]
AFLNVEKDPLDIGDLHASLLRAFLQYTNAGDDMFIFEMAHQGAPLGLDPTHPIPSSEGLFPPTEAVPTSLPGVSPDCGLDLITNYSSVELQAPLVRRMYELEEAKGWMESVPPGDEFRQVRVALILKKSGGDDIDPSSLPDSSL